MTNLKKRSILWMIFFLSISQVVVCAKDYQQSSDYLNASDYKKVVLAIEESDLDAVTLLLEFVDVDSRDEDGDSFLHLAIDEKNVDMVKYLISRGADVNVQNNEGVTCVHYLVEGFVFEVLIAYVYYTGSIACGDNSAKFSDFLDDINFQVYVEISKLLVSAGANPYIKNFEGVSVVDFIEELESEFFEEGQSFNDLDKDSQKTVGYLQQIKNIILQTQRKKPRK